MTEKSGEFVAQFKYTVAILKNGVAVLAGLPVNVDNYKSEHKIEKKELVELLAVKLLNINLLFIFFNSNPLKRKTKRRKRKRQRRKVKPLKRKRNKRLLNKGLGEQKNLSS